MSLIIIPGSAGSGKSTMMFQRVLQEAAAFPMRRYIVLVPEQNTLQTQKMLVSMSGTGGIWNIDVLSFTRLAYRVFEQTGAKRSRILSETGKVLLLRLIAAREGDRIPMLSGILDRPGVLGEIKSILSELDQYGIGPETLRQLEQTFRGSGSHQALARKLSEIALVQEAFERYQAGHMITGEKLLRVLEEKIPLDETLQGATICLDGFTGLTPAQLQVISALFAKARDILVTVTIDPEEVKKPLSQGLFALPLRTIRALTDCARDARVDVTYLPVPPETPGRHETGGELWWLEKHLLRPGKEGRRVFPGGGSRPELFLRQCADPADEAVSAAVTISELMREGMRCREIAIVCGSLKDYAEYVRRALSVYQIPCYIDRTQSVVMNPAFEFALCAISVLEKNFSYESVMALLRTGLVLDPENGGIDLLENYILAAGIRGHKAWSEPFQRQTRDRNRELLEAAEPLRAEWMEKFEPFARVMKKSRATFLEYAGALWHLVLAFDVPGKLERESIRCREDGREERAQEYEAVPGVISSVLDEAALLMGQEIIERTQFAQILKAGFTEARIGILPRGIDQVQVGDLERSRLENIKAVFFLGLNDGFVPPRRKAGGVLTDLEREFLNSRKVRLAPTAREDADIQQYYLYLTLTKSAQALYLSWSMTLPGTGQLQPSGILMNIRRLFPQAAWVNAASAHPYDSVVSPETGKRVLAQAIGDYLYADRTEADWNEPKLRELLSLYRREEDWNRHAEAFLKRVFAQEKPGQLDEETALALYGPVLRGSITRLEEFSGCAFRHFADYGLGLKEREEYVIRTLDIGNLLHGAIEILSGRLAQGEPSVNWHDITDQMLDSLAREALRASLEREHAGELYSDSRRFEETYARCEGIFLRSVKALSRQIRAGAFEPVSFELSFGRQDEDGVWIDNLPGGRKLQLYGKIDRIDECTDEGAKRLYIRIVDYKSSSKDVDLESLIAGEQLQLIVYLDEAARIRQKKHPKKEIVCAGAFYFPFQDPVIDLTPQMTDQEAEVLADSMMRLNGLVNSRQDVLERLESGPWEAGASGVIPVTRNKAPGELRAADNVITDRQFDLLRRYARDRMRKIASAILSGQIAPNPSRKRSGTTSCTWCPYRDVCGFDPHAQGAAYREREKRKADESWALIEETVSSQSPEEGTDDASVPESGQRKG